MFTAARSVARAVRENASNRGEVPRRLLMAFGWRLYRRLSSVPVVTRLPNGCKFVADPRSGNASAAGIDCRVYEPEYTAFVRQHVAAPGGAIIDVGAHIGLFSLQLIDLFSEGYCFEPMPDNFELLRTNYGINCLTRFRLTRAAVSDSVGEATFVSSGAFGAMGHLATDGSATGKPGVADSGTLRTPTHTLDEFLAADPPRAPLTFVKLDVEGHELQVLDGARRVLNENPRALVMAENLVGLAMVEWFERLGWRCCSVDVEGKVLTDRPSLAKAYNVFAVGPEHPLYTQLATA